MTSKKHQEIIIDSLATLANVMDVYFHKGVLYVVNEYDAAAVEEFLQESGWAPDVDFQIVEE